MLADDGELTEASKTMLEAKGFAGIGSNAPPQGAITPVRNVAAHAGRYAHWADGIRCACSDVPRCPAIQYSNGARLHFARWSGRCCYSNKQNNPTHLNYTFTLIKSVRHCRRHPSTC